MNSDFIKLFGPVIMFVAWIPFALRVRAPHVALAGLFFASFAGCSQNFIFIYRDLNQIIQVVMITIALISVAVAGRLHRFNVIFAVLLGFIGFSLMFAPLDEDAQAQLINIIAVVGVVNYVYRFCVSPRQFEQVMDFIGTLAVLCALIGLVERLSGYSVRAEATFSNPNYFAYFLGVGYCIVYVRPNGLWRNLSLAAILLAILASGSRGALIFPLLQLMWGVYRLGNRRKTLAYAIATVVVVAFITASGVTRYSNRGEGQGSDAERLIFATVAFRMAADHPLTGVGWGRYISEFGNYSSNTERVLTDAGGVVDLSTQDRRVTHNDVLRILAELGWLACVVAIAACLRGLAIILKWKAFNLGYLFAMWVGSLSFSLGHNNLNGPLFWFVFVLPFYLYRRMKSVSTERELSISVPQRVAVLGDVA